MGVVATSPFPVCDPWYFLSSRFPSLYIRCKASVDRLYIERWRQLDRFFSRVDPHSDKLRTGQRKNSDHFFTDSQQHFHMQGVVAAGYDSVKKNRSSMRQLSRAKNSENTPQKILGHCPLLSLLIKFEHTVSPARARLYIAGAKTDVPGRANTAGERCQSISRVLIMIIQKSLPPSLKKNLRK